MKEFSGTGAAIRLAFCIYPKAGWQTPVSEVTLGIRKRILEERKRCHSCNIGPSCEIPSSQNPEHFVTFSCPILVLSS